MTRQSRPEGRPYERLGTHSDDTPTGYRSSLTRGSYVRLVDPPATIATRITERVGAAKARQIADALHERADRVRRRELTEWLARPHIDRQADDDAVLARAAAAGPPPSWAELRAARGDAR